MMTATFEDPTEKINHVRNELEKLPGKKNRGSNATMVICPFHNDSNPSARISHNPMRPRSIGWVSCYACGTSKKWNDLAEHAGLEPFGPPQETKEVPSLSFDYVDENLLGETRQELVKENLRYYELNQRAAEFMYLEGLEWRGFDFDFLSGIGAKCCFVPDKSRYYMWLPVFINEKLRGYIKAQPDKPKNKKVPSYVNAAGNWSHKTGLFPYDYAVALMREKRLKTMVLVEGPRDALRLLKEDIPAMCILGTQSWSKHKIVLLENAGVEEIILCPDGDAAGRKMAKYIYHGDEERKIPPIHTAFSCSIFPLEDYTDKDAEDDIDPGNAPIQAIEDLKANLV